MEMRPQYMYLEALRLIATAAGIVITGSWFGAVALQASVQAGIAAIGLAAIVAVWIIFKQPIAAHGHLSPQ
jgi:alkylglycerol monooxygenase